jgi:D-alanyl-D-alanine carboxypeptidase
MRHPARTVGLLMTLTAFVLTAVGCGASESAAPSSTSAVPTAAGQLDAALTARLDEQIPQTMDAASVPGAIVGLWGPDGQYVRAFGVADTASGAPMKTDFYQRIGSLTKTFTVTAVLQLVDQGKLALDDPIGRYLPGVPQGDRITLRDLARMQSGLFNYSTDTAFQQLYFGDPQHPFTPQQLLDYAFSHPDNFAPGQGFEYSNTNTVLLGLLVEKVSGQPLPAYITDHILTPLKLSHTAFPTDAAFPHPHAQGYSTGLDDEQVVTTDWNPSWGWAAGAMTSTLEDMRQWAPALATGTLLSAGTQQQRLQTVPAPGKPAQDGYGLGLFNLGGWIGHNGSLPGYQTVVVYLPEKQYTLVIMTNTDVPADGGEPSTALAKAITTTITPDHVYTLG